MTLNTSKCHLLVLVYKDKLMFAKVGCVCFFLENHAKMLGKESSKDVVSVTR